MIEIGGVHLVGLVAGLAQRLQDAVLVVVAEGLQGDLQLHAALAVDVHELVVLQLDDVAVGLRHELGHPQQLAGAVGELDGEGEHPPPVDEPCCTREPR